eukprot:TRINITY_DN448_c0_g1_i2.p1 TRINITY_DN448_c0_g1~~TRINITY_DN448_c0_g1_i2.p1  ORF type:complete len:524 (+),score=178.02 TRINITY_DN448_c0_g1_i2:177-1574(+)
MAQSSLEDMPEIKEDDLGADSEEDGEDEDAAPIAHETEMEANDGEDEEESPEKKEEIDEFMKSLHLEKYDEEEEGATMFLGGSHLTVDNDPYLKEDDADDDSDNEDYHVKTEDAVLLVGRTDEERNRLEVYIFEEETCNLFVHHDFELPAFPLSFAWMDTDPRNSDTRGNFVAVSTFLPAIEIWNLDVIDALEPVASLGGIDDSEPPSEGKKKKKKKQGKKQKKYLPGSHTDAVLSLSWNQAYRTRLASGSADQSIKLWDVSTQQCTHTLNLHSNKVQSVSFNPAEPNVLLSAGYDRVAYLTDTRDPNPAHSRAYPLDADVENVCWNPHNPAIFAVSTESGNVMLLDARNNKDRVAMFQAHSKATTSLSFNQTIPHLLATASLDQSIKLWDISERPTLVAEKKAAVGSLFSVSFYRDSPFLLAAGGSQGLVAMWDILEDSGIRQRYRGLAPADKLALYEEEAKSK